MASESRFAHLLQPIRELTKNWDIDVAAELNDYLEELDEMCITFDGGKTRLNFAEAALLIQGSTCIYSKKVELLHGLVYQTLEYISERNRKRDKQAAEAQQGGADGAHAERDDDLFTQLDLDTSEDSHKMDSTAPSRVVPLPPESLLPPESREKLKLPLISLKGETLGSVKDFRINIFIPGAADMIVLRLDRCAAEAPWQQGIKGGLFNPAGVPVQNQGSSDPDVHMEEDAPEEEAEHVLGQQEAEHVLGQQEAEHVLRQQASTGRTITERRAPDSGGTEEAPPTVWDLHDPYSVAGEDKPWRSGKCFRVPDGLDEGGKRKRKRGSCLEDFRSWFTGTFNPPEQKLRNGPRFTDLNYVYLDSVRDKLRTHRRICRKTGLSVPEEELRRSLLQPEGAGLEDGLQQADLLGGEDLSDHEQEAFCDDAPAELVGGAENPKDELSYEDLVKLRVEQLVVKSRGYTQETALSQRVQDWKDAIQPQLLLLEQRPAFDIQAYSDRVVAALGSVGHRRTFASLVAGLDNVEACKYLLASLQLANDYTVAVDQLGGLDSSVDSMGLSLLSTLRAGDRFQALRTSQ